MDDEWVKPVLELAKTLDEYIPDPVRPTDKPFLMPIEDIFSIEGRGTVCTGRIERGIVKVNEEVEVVGLGETKKTVVTGIEMFNKQLDEGMCRRQCRYSLEGFEERRLEPRAGFGQAGIVTPHTEFETEVYILTKEEGRPAHTVFQRLQTAILHQNH